MLTGYLTPASRRVSGEMWVVLMVAMSEFDEFYMLKAGNIKSQYLEFVSGVFVLC